MHMLTMSLKGSIEYNVQDLCACHADFGCLAADWLLTLPALLQPTSGLDARAAAIVMRTVRNTVNTGRTVVCTIHQPSIDIFEASPDLQWQACLPGHTLLH